MRREEDNEDENVQQLHGAGSVETSFETSGREKINSLRMLLNEK